MSKFNQRKKKKLAKQSPFSGLATSMQTGRLSRIERLNLMRSVPDTTIGPVYGWKAWDLTRHPISLKSPSQGTIWPYFSPVKADTKPAFVNGAGIYASITPSHAKDYYHGSGAVFGIVALWGAVAQYTEGWRGQYAYPALLLLSGRAEKSQVERLRELYGVPCGRMALQETPNYNIGDYLRADETLKMTLRAEGPLANYFPDLGPRAVPDDTLYYDPSFWEQLINGE